jgi:hypothetical protein
MMVNDNPTLVPAIGVSAKSARPYYVIAQHH